MDQHIYITDTCFDFTKLSISQPSAIQGGSYITKIKCDNNPLYIQTPKCLTKQGLNETSKKAYIDLMYSNDNDTVMEWFENLESTLVKLIYEKRELWFQNEMELEEIENFFNPITRAYKGGKFHLVRINIPRNKTLNSQYLCNVYDENENILPISDLNDTHSIIPCLEVQGIKFSARNFQVELVGKQLMVLINKPIFNSCIIKRDSPKSSFNKANDDDDIVLTNDDLQTVMLSETTGVVEITDNVETSSDTKQNTLETINQDQDQDQDQDPDPITNTTDNQTTSEPDGIITHIDVQGIHDHDNQLEPDDDPIETDNDNNNVSDNADKNNSMKDNLSIININNINNIKKELVSLEDVSNEININNVKANIKLKNPNDVYYEIYRVTKQKAKEHKQAAIIHYLEAKKIKNTYLLNDLYDSNDSSTDEDENSDSEDIKNHMNEFVEELR